MVIIMAMARVPNIDMTVATIAFPECEAFQVSAVGRKDYVTPDGIRVCPAVTLLKTLV